MKNYNLTLFEGREAALQRNVIADYLKVDGGSNFSFMGMGITKLDESPGAQTESEIYIHEVTASSSITRYETSFAFDSRLLKSEEVTLDLWNVGRNHLTGTAAQREYVRVDLYDPVTGEENTYKARKFLVAVEVSSMTGAGGEKLQVSGNLNAVGDPVQGTFNTSTKTFTATVAAG